MLLLCYKEKYFWKLNDFFAPVSNTAKCSMYTLCYVLSPITLIIFCPNTVKKKKARWEKCPLSLKQVHFSTLYFPHVAPSLCVSGFYIELWCWTWTKPHWAVIKVSFSLKYQLRSRHSRSPSMKWRECFWLCFWCSEKWGTCSRSSSEPQLEVLSRMYMFNP